MVSDLGCEIYQPANTMGFAYAIRNPQAVYFITFAVVEWVDVFTRPRYVDILLNSIRYCQREKGLQVHAWVIMSNHVHLIISAKYPKPDLSDIIRDLKKFTSKQIVSAINDQQEFESRNRWMNWIFQSNGQRNSNNKFIQFWQQDNHPVELDSRSKLTSRLSYLHLNPVRAGYVNEPWHYNYSSACDYMANQKGLLEVTFL